MAIKRSAEGGVEVAGLTKKAIDASDESSGLAQLEQLMGENI